MGNKVTLTRGRQLDLYNDSQWKEIIYHVKDVTLDMLSIIYNPKNEEGEKDLITTLAYINKNFGGNYIYFYVNKDVDGIEGLIQHESTITETPQIEE
jgi:hypothetical protein